MRWFSMLLFLLLLLPAFAFAGYAIESPDGKTVNLRSEPSLEAAILTRLSDGTAIEVLATDNEWSQVSFETYTGYIMNDYIVYHEDIVPYTMYILSPNSAPVNIRSHPGGKIVRKKPTGSEVTVLTPGEEWTTIEGPDGPESIRTEYLTPYPPELWEEDPDISYIVSPNSFPVNVREAPNGSIILRAPTGTKVEVIYEEGEWTQIVIYGKNGYVMSRYLSDIRPELIDRSYIAYVETPDGGSVRVRYGAGKGYDVVTRLEDGTEVIVIGSVQGWARIRCGDIDGYIDEEYLISGK